eukprot:scaffold20759_cov70-Attheya_sp.AAC.2
MDAQVGGMADDDILSKMRASKSQAEMNVENGTAPLYKIVLTGGPCGGKTTALARISSYLRERGFEVMTCPEAFGILASNGLSLDYLAAVHGMSPIVQSTVMDLMICLEDGVEQILRARGRPSVMLCDRGLMDGSAYLTQTEWDAFLEKRGVQNPCNLREGRYNAIFHLVTAAEGAERYYTLENNAVRSETPELARVVDQKTQAAWVGHPKLCVFDNSTDFEGKLQRVVNATAKLVGLPSSLSRVTTKYILQGKPDLSKFPPDVKYHLFQVEKVYLYDDKQGEEQQGDTSEGRRLRAYSLSLPLDYTEEYSFVRKRSQITRQGKTIGTVYGQTTVKRTRDEQTIETKRIITDREYANALKNRDMKRHIVEQTRITFIWNYASFNIHMYSEPVSDLCILHAQTEVASDVDESDGSDVDLPPFLDVDRWIQNTKEDEDTYGAFNISLI